MTRIALPAAAVFILAACSDSPATIPMDASAGVTVRDSAGVSIVRHDDSGTDSARQWTLDAQPAIVLGGEDPAATANVASVAILSDGRIAVAMSTGLIDLYDVRGARVGRFGTGREGEGPITSIWRMRAGPDETLRVLDTAAARLVVLDLRGDVTATVPLPEQLAAAPPGSLVQPGNLEFPGVLPDGEMVLAGRPYIERSADGWTWTHATLFGIRVDGSVRGMMRVKQTESIGVPGAPAAQRPHFRGVTELAIRDSAVVVSAGREYRVDFFDRDGAPSLSLRVALPAVTATSDHLDAYRTWLFQQLRDIPNATMREYERAFAATPAASTLPAIRHMIVDRIGCTWVERFPDPTTWVEGADTIPHRWDVFDRTGRRVGWTEVPAGLRVRDADGDRIVATSTSAAGTRAELRGLERIGRCD